MTESAPNPAVESLGTWEVTADEPAVWGGGGNGASGHGAAAGDGAGQADSFRSAPMKARTADITKLTYEHPEVVILAAFAGGLLLATILKRLAK